MAVTLTAAELSEAVGVDSKTGGRLLAVVSPLVEKYAPGRARFHIERSRDSGGRMARRKTGRLDPI